MTGTPTVELTAIPFEDTTLFQFPSLAGVPGLAHAITSKPWNMATHTGPHADLAVTRRRRVCEFLGLPFERLTAADQVHSPHVVRVHAADAGAGRDGRHTALKFVDGLVCGLPGVAIVQFSADCPLVVAVDPERRVVGTAHASWRGTVAEITLELVRQLRREFGVSPGNLLAAICPCAGPCEYEVGEDVRRVALARLPEADRFFPRVDGRLRFDLRAANVDQLVRAGVRHDRIHVAANSTMTDGRFYSHRLEGAGAGRFAVFVGFRG